ncbi:MAG: hypothetical protein QOH78_1886 [Verrucomicrobiota bacterium]|jgi:hypothetical protein
MASFLNRGFRKEGLDRRLHRHDYLAPKKAERKISTFQVFLFTLPNNSKRLNVSELELPPLLLRIQIADLRR